MAAIIKNDIVDKINPHLILDNKQKVFIFYAKLLCIDLNQ